jgi:hypothetical protein
MVDTQHSRFDECHFRAIKICQAAQNKIEEALVAFSPGMSKYSNDLLRVGVQNTWADWLAHLFHLQVFGEQMANKMNISSGQVVVVSMYADLFKELQCDAPLLFPSSSISIIQQPFRNRVIPWLLWSLYGSLRGLFYQLFDFWAGNACGLKFKKHLPKIAFPAVWGIREEGGAPVLLDDLMWWKGGDIPGERVVCFYERPDFQPTKEKVHLTDSIGIQSFVLDRRYPGDSPELVLDKIVQKSFWFSLLEVFKVLKGAVRVLFQDVLSKSAIALGMAHMVGAAKLSFNLKALNVKGLIHYQQVGADHPALAAEFNDACRFTFFRSSVHPILAYNYATSHVVFVWGKNEASVHIDSGCISRYILISGCLVDRTPKVHEKAQQRFLILSKQIRSRGSNYVLALFGPSVLTRDFYSFFLDWLLKDPQLGLIIKSNGDTWSKVQADGLDGLVQRALETGRLQIADATASPADVATAVDFSIGIGSYSAIVVSALKGARVIYVDYQRTDQGPCDKSHLYLHSLGPNRCVFYDFESVKRAILEYANNPESNPNLGDVSPVLDLFDSFRDGLAGQRIGEYIKWYMDGLDKGFKRDDALLHATEKYAAKWGDDKVVRGLPEMETN